MRRANSLLGFLGLVFLVFAVIAGRLTGGRTTVDVVFIGLHAVLGVLALIAYLSTGIENLRTFVGERSTRYGANALLYSLIFIAVLGLLNYLSVRHNHRWDMSEAKVYSLSPQSAKIIEKLDKPLEMLAFVEGGINPPLDDLLHTYKDAGTQVSYRMIDPDRDPGAAKEKKIATMNTVSISYGDQNTLVTQPSEEAITNALIKVTRGAKVTVCFVEGHGEPGIDDQESTKGFSVFKEALESENYTTKKILLANVDKVPDDCNVLVAVAAGTPYLENEIAALGTYLKGGGHLLLMLPPQKGQELKPLLADWGVAAGDDVVVDQVMQIFQGPKLGIEPITNIYGKHEITEPMGNRISNYPMTRSISAGETKPQLLVSELVKTSESSWAETDLDALFNRRPVKLDEGVDKAGPVSIAVAVESKVKQQPDSPLGRLVVFGSSDMADNRSLAGEGSVNRELLLNAVGWLSAQSDLVSIRPRAIRSSRFQLTQDQGTAIFYFSVLLLPELLLVLGLTVWWRRSNA